LVKPSDEKLLRRMTSQGRKAIENHIFKDLDLSEANLTDLNPFLSTIGPFNFKGANLSGGNFYSSQMFFPNFSKANLSKAKLVWATLVRPDLSNTNLRGADLGHTFFAFPTLRATDLSGATVEGTAFITCNLSQVKGLSTIKHKAPSMIDVNTLILTSRAVGGKFPPEIRTFLLRAGVKKALLDVIPKIAGKAKYFSCFIGYGTPDKKFALKIRNSFDSRGVTSWLYALDAKVGRSTWNEINQKRRESERMIVICSAKSLVRPGVLKEIEAQIDDDPDSIIVVSADNLWKEPGFPVQRNGRDLKGLLLEKNYADFANLSYKKALDALIDALEKP
jgi:uncharacterized protein YjbI with pentapeptide repeats